MTEVHAVSYEHKSSGNRYPLPRIDTFTGGAEANLCYTHRYPRTNLYVAVNRYTLKEQISFPRPLVT